MKSRGLALFLLIVWAVCVPWAAAAGAGFCIPPREAKEIVASKHVLAPFEVMNAMSTLARADPVTIRLCRSGETLIYEVVLLHRDGRLLRIYVDAVTGKTINPK